MTLTSRTKKILLIAAFILIAVPVFAMTGSPFRSDVYGRGRQDGRRAARAVLPMVAITSATSCCGCALPSMAWTGWNPGRREFLWSKDWVSASATGCGTCCGFGPGLSLLGVLTGADCNPTAIVTASRLPTSALVGKPAEYVQGCIESCER